MQRIIFQVFYGMTIQNNTDPVEKLISNRTDDAIQRQQLITYLIATGLVIVGMSLHLSGILGANLPVLRLLSVLVLFGCVVMFSLWLSHQVTVKTAYNVTAILVQCVQTAKILYVACAFITIYNHLVVMNGFISMMLMMVLVISYLRKMAIIVGVANIITLLTAGFIINDRILWQYITLIILFTVFFIIMADLMYRNVKRMKEENIEFQTNEQNLIAAVRLNRKEINAYLAMCRADNPTDGETERLFNILSEKSQRNVINVVERKKAIDGSQEDDIKAAFPNFTPMELEVSRLVLRGMKLSQIINITGKTESNISVVRSRIRKKLHLEAGDDLYEALKNRMQGRGKY